MQPRKLRRVVIKEELVALTGSYKRAIILHQLDYWQGAEFERTGRLGWFRRSAAEIAERTLINLSASNILAHVAALVDAGWVERRNDPADLTGKAKQYRVNLEKLRRDLAGLGYPLEGWTFSETEKAFSKTERGFSKTKQTLSKTESPSYIENTNTPVDVSADEIETYEKATGRKWGEQ